MPKQFNPPPNWPTPPAGWTPPEGWTRPPDLPPPPPGWQLWVEVPKKSPWPARHWLINSVAAAGVGCLFGAVVGSAGSTDAAPQVTSTASPVTVTASPVTITPAPKTVTAPPVSVTVTARADTSTGAQTQSGTDSGSESKTDPRFGTCAKAIANGYGPYRSGVDPEYQWYRDADGDGVVCES